ncbi:MAG: P-loop NTPase fold protein [Candidatus Methylopumilus sp.]|jgi:hypothetical protein
MKTLEELESTWPNDSLQRTGEGRYLIKYLNALYGGETDETLYGSFVLNLNAPWGYGKTFFLDNLKLDLMELNHPVVYFDAWGNDYTNTPLLSFISEIQSSLKPYVDKTPNGKRLLKSFNEKGKKIIGAVAGIGTSILAKKLTGYSLAELKGIVGIDENDIATMGDKISEKSENIIGKIVQKSLDEHQQLKQLILDFKTNLEDLMVALNEDSNFKFPMYILVDELDRCRPDFAVELLENIKHIFNSKGVFFIVATNKEQLVNSIKAIYGNQFDSFSYLKRFFNQEYNLSLPDTMGFSEALFKKYRISNEKLFFPIEPALNPARNVLAYMFSQMSSLFGLGLRDKEQICIQLKSILLTCGDEKLHYPFLIYILIIKHNHREGDIEKLAKAEVSKLDSAHLVISDKSDFGEPRPSITVSYLQLINFYMKLTGLTNKKINQMNIERHNSYESQVVSLLLQSSRNGIPFTDLSEYYSLVEKAGHFG